MEMKKAIKKLLTKELILYVSFGVFTTLICLVVYWLCKSMGFSAIISNTISTFVAVIFAYVTNKIWVFKCRDYSLKNVLKEMGTFFAARLLTYILETAALFVLVDVMGLTNLVKILTTGVVIIINYFLSKKAVFVLREAK